MLSRLRHLPRRADRHAGRLAFAYAATRTTDDCRGRAFGRSSSPRLGTRRPLTAAAERWSRWPGACSADSRRDGHQTSVAAHRGIPRTARCQLSAAGRPRRPPALRRFAPMPVRAPAPATSSRSRPPAATRPGLQLQRLRGRCATPTTTCRTTAAFDTKGVHPDDFKRSPTSAKFPFTTRSRPARQLPLRHVSPCPRSRCARACLVGHHRQAHRGGLRWATSTAGPSLVARARSAPPAVAPGDIVHIAYGCGLFTGGLGRTTAPSARLHGDPDVGRPDREAGAADRLPARHHRWSRRATCR